MEKIPQKLAEQLEQINVLLAQKKAEREDKNPMCKASMETLLLSIDKRLFAVEEEIKNLKIK
jgi:hypothetical protein